MNLLLLVFVASLSTTWSQQTKITINTKIQLIVNGNPTTADQYPFIADIRGSQDVNNLDSSFCTGSLYRKQRPAVILTAAHCFDSSSLNTNAVSLLRNDIDEPFDANTNPFLFYPVCGGILHPAFDADELFNDIALLFLDVDLSDNTDVECVTIADNECAANEAVQGMGYGSDMVRNGPATDTLEYIDMTCLSATDCDNEVPGSIANFTCAFQSGVDTCTGDSGGPLIKTGTNTQYGVLSFGLSDCDTTTPSGYTNIVKYKEWIDSNIDQFIADNPSKSATPTSAPTAGPVASQRTDSPSSSPTASPVATEMSAPSSSPVAAPSSSPVATPSASPIVTETDAPSASPVAAPSESPISALIMPSSSPITATVTDSPTAAPNNNVMFSVQGTLLTSTPFDDISGLSADVLNQWALEVVTAGIGNLDGVQVVINSVGEGEDGFTEISYMLLSDNSVDLVLALLNILQTISDETVISTTAGVSTTITDNEVEDLDLISESESSSESSESSESDDSS